MRSTSCLLLLLFATPLAAAPQTTPTIPHAGESIEVSIVNVDTVVTDKQGHRIHGLRREDFEVYENGVRQPITNFGEYASEREATSAGVATPSAVAGAAHVAAQPLPHQKRTIIVFVERFQLASFRSDPMFAAMKNVQEDLLRGIARKRKFMKTYAVVRNLINNPRTPLDLSLGLLPHMLSGDLKNLSMNKNISETIRKVALKMFREKTSGKKGG